MSKRRQVDDVRLDEQTLNKVLADLIQPILRAALGTFDCVKYPAAFRLWNRFALGDFAFGKSTCRQSKSLIWILVGRGGLEPPTSRLSGVRSNHLSYRPNLVERIGIEPMTPCLQSRCSPS